MYSDTFMQRTWQILLERREFPFPCARWFRCQKNRGRKGQAIINICTANEKLEDFFQNTHDNSPLRVLCAWHYPFDYPWGRTSLSTQLRFGSSYRPLQVECMQRCHVIRAKMRLALPRAILFRLIPVPRGSVFRLGQCLNMVETCLNMVYTCLDIVETFLNMVATCLNMV